MTSGSRFKIVSSSRSVGSFQSVLGAKVDDTREGS
jgi:hypothetical protein